MDLTKSYPRSVRDTFAGVVMIVRTADKAKAQALGDLGEYHYDCPMDRGVFGFLGIDSQAFLEVVKNATSDAEVETYVAQFAAKKTPAEIERWNAQFLAMGPQPGDSERVFLELRQAVAPDRADVTAWADLLDLDEKREVPRKTPA
jgi:hypothetical protein